MKPRKILRFRRSPEQESKSRRPDSHSGSVAVSTEVEKPKPTFVELFTDSGAETPTIFINDLFARARTGDASDVVALREAFDAIPEGSRVGVYPKGYQDLPAVFHGQRFHDDSSVGEDGISMLKSGNFKSQKLGWDSHVDIDLSGGEPRRLTYRAGLNEKTVDLPFDHSNEALFRITIKLPESPSE